MGEIATGLTALGKHDLILRSLSPDKLFFDNEDHLQICINTLPPFLPPSYHSLSLESPTLFSPSCLRLPLSVPHYAFLGYYFFSKRPANAVPSSLFGSLYHHYLSPAIRIPERRDSLLSCHRTRPSCDLFSLGVIVCEMTTLSTPMEIALFSASNCPNLSHQRTLALNDSLPEPLSTVIYRLISPVCATAPTPQTSFFLPFSLSFLLLSLRRCSY
jgi:serine/threonine protein kinase